MVAAMSERTPADTVAVLEAQLERAYKNGRRDERASARTHEEAARADGLRRGHDTLLAHVKAWRIQDHYERRAVITERIEEIQESGDNDKNTITIRALLWVLQQIDAEEHYYAP